MNAWNGTFYSLFVWITRFAYLQLLWLLFMLAGGIIFGFYPSTNAMFAIVRDWLRGKTDEPLFRSFASYFKREFWKSNRLGFIITAFVLLIVLDFVYFQMTGNTQLSWTKVPLFAFMLLFLLFLLYLFPSFAHFDLSVRQLLKQTLLIMLVKPFHSMLMLLSFFCLFLLMYFVPALGFIFGGSSYTFITMSISLHAFNSLQRENGE
ncbi:YesL family protein [Falsibacillus albus]|uniref:DUF624 domain-containing protein n=1 Tax=Falsibacillus albus TaxID=2478915 RepID=A0A3L7JUS9_9BACI|nr:DUF624 domain-containing protein [Falsibacillus albus]RLQ94637.1 DUF624 domain-containing protein [Falsibacillus albus]